MFFIGSLISLLATMASFATGVVFILLLVGIRTVPLYGVEVDFVELAPAGITAFVILNVLSWLFGPREGLTHALDVVSSVFLAAVMGFAIAAFFSNQPQIYEQLGLTRTIFLVVAAVSGLDLLRHLLTMLGAGPTAPPVATRAGNAVAVVLVLLAIGAAAAFFGRGLDVSKIMSQSDTKKSSSACEWHVKFDGFEPGSKRPRYVIVGKDC